MIGSRNLSAAIMSFALSSMMAILAAPEAGAGTSASFQFWTLAMSYQNEFCATHAQNPECPNGIARVKGLTLHGFWPSLNSGARFESPIGYTRAPVQSTTIGELESVMPSANCHVDGSYSPADFCLVDHEWEVHGTLSGMQADHYFQTAKILADRFRALPGINGFLERHSGRAVTAGQLGGALQFDLAGARTKLMCESRTGGDQWLVEIEIALDLRRYDAFPIASSFHAPFRNYDGVTSASRTHPCPARGRIYIQ